MKETSWAVRNRGKSLTVLSQESSQRKQCSECSLGCGPAVCVRKIFIARGKTWGKPFNKFSMCKSVREDCPLGVHQQFLPFSGPAAGILSCTRQAQPWVPLQGEGGTLPALGSCSSCAVVGLSSGGAEWGLISSSSWKVTLQRWCYPWEGIGFPFGLQRRFEQQ